MKCAIHQPQFMPWLGYLQKISRCDVFVFLDNVQFHKNEFQNRNRICTPTGVQWMTVPVTFRFGNTIREVGIAERIDWRQKLWRTLEYTYAKAPHFHEFGAGLKDALFGPASNLAEINLRSVRWLLQCFDIKTPSVIASELPEFSEDRTQRLVDICRHLGADMYFSGSQAQCYLQVERFEQAGMRVEFQHFEHPAYPQCNSREGFVPYMSAVDGLFNVGGGAEGRRLLNLQKDGA